MPRVERQRQVSTAPVARLLVSFMSVSAVARRLRGRPCCRHAPCHGNLRVFLIARRSYPFGGSATRRVLQSVRSSRRGPAGPESFRGGCSFGGGVPVALPPRSPRGGRSLPDPTDARALLPLRLDAASARLRRFREICTPPSRPAAPAGRSRRQLCRQVSGNGERAVEQRTVRRRASSQVPRPAAAARPVAGRQARTHQVEPRETQRAQPSSSLARSIIKMPAFADAPTS